MPIKITTPADGERLDIDAVLTFRGTAGATISAVSLIADDQFDLGAADVIQGKWTLDHSFSRPGVRKITAKGLDSNGNLVDSFSLQIILVTDATSCAFKQGLFLVGGHMVFHLPGDQTFFYTAGLAVDADGSPHAYNPQNTGLDNLINAKDSQGNFVGVVTDNHGHPIIQGQNDPAPGFYVSQTSLMDTGQPRTSPLRYVDAEKVPFIVLPPKGMASGGAVLGDFVAVYRARTDTVCFGLFADIGPRTKLGEGSVALAKALGIPASPRTGGTDKGLLYIVFPGSRAAFGQPWTHHETQATIDAEAGKHFEAWGGLDRVKACFAELQ